MTIYMDAVRSQLADQYGLTVTDHMMAHAYRLAVEHGYCSLVAAAAVALAERYRIIMETVD